MPGLTVTTAQSDIHHEALQKDIAALLDDLPSESLVTVKEFVTFMHYQLSKGQIVSTTEEHQAYLRYPTIGVSPARILKLAESLSQDGFGYEGNALVDSEAVYDDVSTAANTIYR